MELKTTSILDDDSIKDASSQEETKKKVLASQTHVCILYPDCPEHASALSKIMKWWDYTYILHDKDLCTENDEFLHHDENVKKPHYHVIIHLVGKKRSTQVARELMLPQNYVRRVSDRNAMLLYLIHIGQRDKHQYDIKEVHSNRPSYFMEALNSVNTSTEKLMKMISIIQNKNCTSRSSALRCLASVGLTQFAMKHYNIVRDLVDEQRELMFTPFYSCNTSSKPINFQNCSEDELDEFFGREGSI